MKYHAEILYAKYHFVRHVGWHLKLKNVFRHGQKRPKSAKYAISMILLGVAMATRVGKMNYLFLFLIDETYGSFKKVQVGKDQEKAQSERDSHSKNRGGKKPN